jgi:hypothetical protein
MERTNETNERRKEIRKQGSKQKQIPRFPRDDKVDGATDDCAKLSWRTASQGGPYKDESKETKTERCRRFQRSELRRRCRHDRSTASQPTALALRSG